MRSRIIEFILKRKRLSEDANDDFAFGIDRALNEGIYTAAYPLHDVSGGRNTYPYMIHDT
jgi:anoctamin-1